LKVFSPEIVYTASLEGM